LIADAVESELETVGSFGEAIGIGFQVRDDLLNLTEKSEKRLQALVPEVMERTRWRHR
jgi:geranylgeranyl pyrophosphate synthase